MLQAKDISLCFNLFDPASRGIILEDDAGCLLQALIGDMSTEEVHATVKAMDVECNGQITRADFERLVLRKSTERSLPEDTWRSFVCLSQGRGKVDAADFKRFCSDNAVSNAELHAICRILDVEKQPVLYEAWKRMISSLPL